MADANIMAALLDYIATDSDVTDQVSTRMYGGDLPQSEADDMPRKAIVLRVAGVGSAPVGKADWTYQRSIRIDAWHYGENYREADVVRRNLHLCLQQIGRVVQGDVLIHSAEFVAGPIQIRDPDTDWPILIDTWSIMYSGSVIS